MSDETRQAVIMTDEEKAEFEAFRKEKARKARQEKQKADREAYKQMVDEEIEKSIPVLLAISGQIRESKQRVLDDGFRCKPRFPPSKKWQAGRSMAG